MLIKFKKILSKPEKNPTMKKTVDPIVKAVVSLDLDEIEGLCKKVLDEGVLPYEIIGAMGRGMNTISEKGGT